MSTFSTSTVLTNLSDASVTHHSLCITLSDTSYKQACLHRGGSVAGK